MSKFLFFTFTLILSSAFGQIYNFKNFSFSDGLNYANITAINQDANGVIWLGTKNGPLIRFDNEKFEEIDGKTKQTALNINSISIFNEKIIYSTPTFGIYEYNKNNGVTTKIKRDLNDQLNIIHYHKNNDSELVFTETSIISYNNGKVGTLKNLSYSSSPLKIYQIIEKNGSRYILSNLGFYTIKDNKCSKIIEHEEYNDNFYKFSAAYAHSDKLILFDFNTNKFLTLNDDFTLNPSTPFIDLKTNEKVISIDQSVDFLKTVALTDQGRLFELIEGKWKLIIQNSTAPIKGGQKVFLDYEKNIWITSSTNGLYYISKKIFTKIATSDVLSENLIYVNQYQEKTFITTEDSISYVGNIQQPNSFQRLDFRINCMVHRNEYSYIGTENGVIQYNNTNSAITPLFAEGHSVSAIENTKNTIIAGVNNKGVFIFTLKNGNSRLIPKKRTFQAFQRNKRTSKIHLATDKGPHILDLVKSAVIPVSRNQSRSISSAIDSHGTFWVLSESELIGLKENSKISEVQFNNAVKGQPKILIIDSDNNFIIGTSCGVAILKISEDQITQHSWFSKKNGFDGYSCISNVQASGKLNLFATRNGLFLYNSKVLKAVNTPYQPVVLLSPNESSERNIALKSINFLGLPITYQYKGANTKWRDVAIEKIESINISSTKPIDFRATYDGINFSPTATLVFPKKKSFWNSEWFVLFSIAFLFLLNFVFVSNYFNGKTKTIINTQEELDFNSENKLILFCLLSAPITIALPNLNSQNLVVDLLPEIILFIFLILLYALHTKKRILHQSFVFIHVIFACVILITLYRLYVTNLNPYYMVGTVVISGFLPLLSKRIIIPIIYSISLVVISIYFTLIIETPVFPINLYWAVMFGCISLILFSTFLRSVSIKKLLFTSSVVNYGKVFSIGFDENGIVTFITQNFLDTLNIKQEDILHKSIKILNDYTAPFNNAHDFDVLTHFEKHDKYLVAIISTGQDICWLEWEQKIMKDNTRILYGRDVTNELDLENTYELLVQNAQDFIYRCDINGNFKFMNDIGFNKLGYEKEDLIGKYSIHLAPEKHRKRLEEFYALHFQEKRKYSYLELPIMKKNGDWVWIGQYVTTIFSIGSDTHIDGFIALARDITEKRETQSVIEKQHKVIQNNLQYARSIQKSMLPSEVEMKTVFKDLFLFSKQTDQPSGDFYWTKKIDKKEFLILADCANDVISGNYISLFINNLLNTIILEDKIYSPEAILNELDKRIEQVFPKGNNLIKGIEFTVCQIQDNKILYACAGSQFIISEADSLTICSGSNKKIAENENESHPYNLLSYTFKKDVNLTFFTNGFHTQKGTHSDKTEFGLKRMIQLFESNAELPLEAQKSLIEKSWTNWVGNEPPKKDVTIISIRKSRYVKN